MSIKLHNKCKVIKKLSKKSILQITGTTIKIMGKHCLISNSQLIKTKDGFEFKMTAKEILKFKEQLPPCSSGTPMPHVKPPRKEKS